MLNALISASAWVQLLGTEGSALACLAGVGDHICPYGVHIWENLPHPDYGCTKRAAAALAMAMSVSEAGACPGHGGPREIGASNAFLLRIVWEGGCLELQIPLLGEYLSHEAMKLSCSSVFPV